MKQLHDVHLVTTDNPTFPCITLSPKTELFFNTQGLVKGIGFSYFHLYITSNEEIKEGDENQYIIHPLTNTILKIIRFLTDGLVCENIDSSIEHGLGMNYKSWKKIIATTNSELWYDKKDEHFRTMETGVPPQYPVLIPKIPQSFIEVYNKSKVIKQIELEYYDNCLLQENASCSCHKTGIECNKGLKLTDKGEVIVSLLEEKLYTKDEMKSEFTKFLNQYGFNLPALVMKGHIDEWFDKNYPQ